jgi:hypothetical protein
MNLFEWIVDNFLIISGLIATIRWIWEYSQRRKFEKNKFLLERIEKFNNNPSVKKIQKILDWNSIIIEINGVEIKVNDAILIEAFKTHNEKKFYNKTEIYLREIFDDYLTGLTELIILSKTGLVDKNNLRKFLQYWLDVLNGKMKNKPKSLVNTFNNFIEYYGYSEISKFIK